MTAPSADVIVLGGGVVGAATARAAAGQGASVMLIEQGSLEAAAGSSRGSARIIAPAAYPERSDLDAGLRALEGWRSLEQEAGVRLLELSGALYQGTAVKELADHLEDAGAGFRFLTGDDVRRRFGIDGPDADQVLFQFDAGVIRARPAHAALLRSALGRGAELRAHERVTGIDPDGDEVAVRTTRGTHRGRRLVIAAGPWSEGVLSPLGIDLRLSVSSQSVAYFRPPPGAADVPALMEFDGAEPYALIDPERGLKASLHRRGPEVDPGDHWSVVDTRAIDLIRNWVASRFPGLDDRPVEVEACLYTNTPDERFAIEAHGPLIAASACNGQGFQFAPDTGSQLARMALA